LARLIVLFVGTLGALCAAPGGAAAAVYNLLGAPKASFVWSPQLPRIGEPTTLTSTSSVIGSHITSYAWDFSDNGPFGAFENGGPVASVSYGTPGQHVVRLRVTAANGLSNIAAETITMAALPESAGVLNPFPIVRISGRDFPFRVRIKRLAVKAPAGARISVTCRHAGCPVRAAARTAKAGHATWVTFRRFERSFAAGSLLEIRVSRAGKIGSYTRFQVRRRRFPLRHDSCLSAAGIKPIPCPSS
jgi:PKD repeat protein